MKTPPTNIAISDFKATCLAVLERVRATGESIVVTRHGKPVARVTPVDSGRSENDWMGSLRDRIQITGDVVSPASDAEDWEVLGK